MSRLDFSKYVTGDLSLQHKQRAPGPGYDGADVPVPAGDGADAGLRGHGPLRAAPALLGALRTLCAYCEYLALQ